MTNVESEVWHFCIYLQSLHQFKNNRCLLFRFEPSYKFRTKINFPYPLSKTLSSSPSRAPKPCPELAPKRLHHYCFFFFSDSILSRLTNPSSPNQFFFFFFFDDYIAFLYRFFMSHHCHSLLVLPLSVLYLRYTPFPSLCVFSVLIFILDFGIEIVVFCKIIPLNFGPFMPDLSD